MASPKPQPMFSEQLFSPKRRGGAGLVPPTPEPPRPPSKSVTPRSRVFGARRDTSGVELIASNRGKGCLSPHYNARVNATYFEQCFDNLGELGRGSYSVVFKARSRDDRRIYAIKKATKRIKNRSKRLAELKTVEAVGDSPYCLRYFDAWEENDTLFMQTEFCANGSLQDYAYKVGTVPERQVWQFLVDVALGLDAIHSHDMIHLDIKPANLFLDSNMTLKVGDFGIASKEDAGDREEGDPVYMAPELLDENFGKPADVFSLGISMLDIACGRELPGSGPGWQALRSGHIPDMLLKGLSKELARLLQRMMHPDPRQRPTIAEVLTHPRVAQIVRLRRVKRVVLAPFRLVVLAVTKILLFLGFLLNLVGLRFPRLTRGASQVSNDEPASRDISCWTPPPFQGQNTSGMAIPDDDGEPSTPPKSGRLIFDDPPSPFSTFRRRNPSLDTAVPDDVPNFEPQNLFERLKNADKAQ